MVTLAIFPTISKSPVPDSLAATASRFNSSAGLSESTKQAGGLSPQFVHEACYARIKGQRRPTKSGGRTGDAKAAASEIIGEILREKPEHYRHLTAQGISPRPPICLWGVRPEDLMTYYVDLVKKSKRQFESLHWSDGRVTRRKQRSSTTILGVCVASYPGPADIADHRYARWKLRVIAFAIRRYGKSLRGVYEHREEQFGHVHMVFDKDGANVKSIMAGPSAAIQARGEGAVGKSVSDALKVGYQRFQDEFWRVVSRPMGFARIGRMPRPRLSWKDAKAKTRALEVHLAETDALRKMDRNRAKKLMDTASALGQWIRERVGDGSMKSSEADDIARAGGLVWRRQRLDIEL